jgi:hypothetical protein
MLAACGVAPASPLINLIALTHHAFALTADAIARQHFMAQRCAALWGYRATASGHKGPQPTYFVPLFEARSYLSSYREAAKLIRTTRNRINSHNKNDWSFSMSA